MEEIPASYTICVCDLRGVFDLRKTQTVGTFLLKELVI